MAMKKAVFGIVKTENQAINIANQLQAAGFSPNDISVLFPDRTGTRDFAHEQHTKAPEGAAAGAAAGGLAGALIGMGIPELEAKQYEGKIKNGNILLSVHAEDGKEVTRAKEILKNGGAEDISYTGEASVPNSARA